ncbi:exo-rhamnogalacturonan lyase family protein [Lignipirellula cremea]|uniref:exo-rhamnogalacturonan lyase family protein n=1 Tax=Lignipirellula cremea TaxID=2528010 RepID=UPI00119D4B0E|nr:hypothetical protein [Lignipirellula cremea]
MREKPKSVFPAEGIPLQVTAPAPADVKTWHFRTGVPLGLGALKTGEQLALFCGEREIPVQTEVLATWGPPDSEFGQAVKWLGVDFVDAAAKGESLEYRLKRAMPADTERLLRIEETAQTITVDNGRLRFVISKPGSPQGLNLFQSVEVDGKPVIVSGSQSGAYLVDGQGREFCAALDATAELRVEMQGPQAAVIRAEGWFVNPDAEVAVPAGEPQARPQGGFCRFVTRIDVAAGQPDVRLQHTFVLTEDSEKTTYGDIGFRLPLAPGKTTVQFGGVDETFTEPVHLLQKSWDAFDLVAGNKTQVQGEAAEGWVRAGKLGLAVRDFWQNFPLELEADPAAGQLAVHFWPKHGAPRMETSETLSDDNAWRLPFVHSGSQLDFRVPQALKDARQFKALHAGGYAPKMYLANAIGIAKTHELLINFDAEQDFPDRAAVFQANGQMLPGAEAIAATKVFGPIPAADPEKYPLIEHRFNNSMKWIIRSKDAFGSFGMWNYGDVQMMFVTKHGMVWPDYRRLWGATHYNNARVAWWLAWRSGDQEILQHARRETQHLIDVDHCHWTNAFFTSLEQQPTDSARKEVGGLCDYKGVVHWHCGDGGSYNACLDYMLYDYYFTGNRRAWDVAQEHGDYITRTAAQNIGRGAAGQSDTLVEYYQATWNPKVGEKLRHHAERIMATPADQHDDLLDWTPWLQRYWELTHDPGARDYLLDWVENRGGGRLYLDSYAWYMTGDRDYATRCARTILRNSLTTAVRDDENDGVIGRFWKSWTDGVTAELLSLAAARSTETTLADFQPEEWPYWVGWNVMSPPTFSRSLVADYFGGTFPWPDQDQARITAVIHHEGGRPTPLWVGSIQQDPRGVNFRVTAPSGSIVSEFFRPGYWRVIQGSSREGPTALRKTWPPKVNPGDKVQIEDREFTVNKYRQVVIESQPLTSQDSLYELASRRVVLDEKNAPGFYTVTYDGTLLQPVPLLPPDRKIWLKVGAESTMRLAGFQYFYVPQETEHFELSFLPGYTRDRFDNKLELAAGAILNPDADPVAPIRCGLETRPNVVRIDVPPQHRGKTWCIAGSGYCLTAMEGVPPYLSPSFRTFASEPRVPTLSQPE